MSDEGDIPAAEEAPPEPEEAPAEAAEATEGQCCCLIIAWRNCVLLLLLPWPRGQLAGSCS